MTWNNALQEWQLLGATGGVLATMQPENPDFFLSLSPASTNIPIPAGFGLSTSDSVAAFAIGNLGPGASMNTNVDFLLSPSIQEWYFYGDVVAAAPEPVTVALLAVALMPF